MPRVLIVADDLSGAADSGVAAAAAGLRTLVILDAADVPDGADAVAVDADTRRLAALDAGAETAKVMRRYYQPGQIAFKKLDSTLRGHFAMELHAALGVVRAIHGQEGKKALAIVAPAFPATGRTTRDGMQLLNGIPLAQTEIWRRDGITGRAYIPELLQTAELRSVEVKLDIVRSGEIRLSAFLRELAPGSDAAVCDAETEDDLEIIVAAGRSSGRPVIWAGSAGLARCLFRPSSSPSVRLPDIQKPALFVIGSASTLARRQALAVAAEPDVATVVLSPGDLLSAPDSEAFQHYSKSLAAALSAGRDTVLLLSSDMEGPLEYGRQLCLALAQLVAPHAGAVGALVLTGGETARAILQAFGIRGLWLLGEIEPGVPLSVTKETSLPVITKAGAFGDQGSLRRCRAALRNHSANLLKSVGASQGPRTNP